jgi:hypothetical protein
MLHYTEPKEETVENKGTLVEIDLTREETKAEEIEVILGDYEFVLKDGKTYFVKKKPEYPKTYEECCEVLVGRKPNPHVISFDKMELCLVDLDNSQNIYFQTPQLLRLNGLFKLLMCRNAYWKIAGEQMGLSESWEPDWKDETEIYYIISYDGVNIKCYNNTDRYSKLAFPTLEMRDVFYKNFKDLIEQCKELL